MCKIGWFQCLSVSSTPSLVRLLNLKISRIASRTVKRSAHVQSVSGCRMHCLKARLAALCSRRQRSQRGPSQRRPLRAPLLTRHLEVVVQRPGAGALRSLLEGSSKKAEAGAEIWMSATGKDVYWGRSEELFPGWEVEMASRWFYRCSIQHTPHLLMCKNFTMEAFRN